MVKVRNSPSWIAVLPALCCAALWTGTAAGQDGQGSAAAVIGNLRLSDATVSGALEVSGERAVVRGGSTIAAKGQTAELRLERGGFAEVCATSRLHVTSGASTPGTPTPLLFGLERGAMELRTVVEERDVVITPDLRFTVRSRGPLDLRMRVTQNGDTCVESFGARAPALEIVDQFGTASYELRAGQHVLFEHASLREVVDHETSPCGCPAAVPAVFMAEAGRTAGAGAAAEHPFPAAESQGLTADSAVPQATPGQVHAEVAAALSYDSSSGPGGGATAGAGRSSAATGTAAPGPSGGAATPQPAVPANGTGAGPAGNNTRAMAPPPPSPAGATEIAHRIGRFFRRLFGKV